MAAGENNSVVSKLTYVVALAVVVVALYWASDIFIPFTLAILISFLLAPLVNRLERMGLHRIPAVTFASILAFVLIAGVTWAVVGQLYNLASSLPYYQRNIHEKFTSLRGESSAFHRLSAVFQEVSREVEPGAASQPSTLPSTQPSTAPAPVEAQSTPVPTPLELVRTAIKFLFSPLATAGIVAIFVIFMLLQREDLRNRLIRLSGNARVSLTTQAINEAAQRVSRYLLSQFFINAGYGIVVAVGLSFMGLPSAVLWGLLAALLRFVPYLGIWVAAVGPLLLSLAVFHGWAHLLMVAGMYVGMELVVANLVEPWLYGQRAGISPLAVLLAAVFWTWLWGGVGLLLSTPMTVCLVVMGKYVPQLEFFTVLLGDEPALSPRIQFYQRLLALDPDEAAQVIEDWLARASLAEALDALALPALLMLDDECRVGRVNAERCDHMRQALRDVLEDISHHHDGPAPGDESKTGSGGGLERLTQPQGPLVLCLPARTESDRIAGVMFAQVLTAAGQRALAPQSELDVADMIRLVSESGAGMVCISSTPPAAVARARYLARQLRGQFTDMPILVGLWGAEAGAARDMQRVCAAGANGVATSFSTAASQITSAAAAPAPAKS